MKNRNKISINAASGIIKIGATSKHPFKYTYYQPLSELEYTTESADDFLEMLKQMFFHFSFYSLDNKDDVLILQTFNEMSQEIKAKKRKLNQQSA